MNMKIIKIATNKVVPGMKVAYDILSSNNILIVSNGTYLDVKMIEKLHIYNIKHIYIYVKNEHLKIEEETFLGRLKSTKEFKRFNETYDDVTESFKGNFGKIALGENDIKIEDFYKDTEKIINESRNVSHILEMMQGMRSYDDVVYSHSINVSIICSVFAKWLKLSEEETKILTLCGLLHDVGKMVIPDEIINKSSKLTEEEYRIMKTHTQKGYQLLKNQDIDIRIKYAALLHHERCDGSGYPNRFTRDNIEAFSKIVAIADVYDAMTSDRVYRDAICPFDVVEEFEKEGLQKYDPAYILIFLERIISSYIHNTVRLNDGREGKVIMINKYALSKPVVMIDDEFVDLSKEKHLRIVSVL